MRETSYSRYRRILKVIKIILEIILISITIVKKMV